MRNSVITTVEGSFASYVADLKPTPSERAQASQSQLHVRDVLTRAASRGDIPKLLGTEFLTGSYARFTKPHPLDDVDLIVPMNGAGLVPTSGGTTVGTVEGTWTWDSPILGTAYDDQTGNKSSIKVLTAFQRVLDAAYEGSTVVRDGQAINVWLASYGLGLDIVPAFHIQPFWGRDYYYIPRGHNLPNWMPTNPKLDQELLDAQCSEWGHERLREVIVLLKRWNQQLAQKLKPYHLEVLIRNHFRYRALISYSGAAQSFLCEAASLIEASCPDLTGLGSNLDDYLSAAQRSAIAAAAREHGDSATMALFFEQRGEVNAALSCWGRVFGEEVA